MVDLRGIRLHPAIQHVLGLFANSCCRTPGENGLPAVGSPIEPALIPGALFVALWPVSAALTVASIGSLANLRMMAPSSTIEALEMAASR